MKGHLIQSRIILTIAIVTALLLTACAGNPQKAKLNYLEKGKAYMKKGAYSSAAIEFRNALKIDPKYTEAYYQLAQADIAQRDGQGAFDALNSAIEIDPNRADVRILHGEINAEIARQARKPEYYSDAEKDANFVLKQDPQNAPAHRFLGSTFAAERKYDQALQEFSTESSLEPAKAFPHMEMGMILQFALHRLPEAEQNFKKAIELEPKNAQTYIGLAQFYDSQKRLPEAEDALRRGAQSVPGNIPIYMHWAATLAREGKTSDADATLKVLRDQQPKSVDVATAIGDYYLQRNLADQALAEYQRGLSIEPKNLTLQQKMEDIYLATGKTEPAAQIDAALMKQAPNDSTNKITHGRLLMAQGRVQDAVTALQKAVADAADSSQAHYWLGMAHWKNGHPDQANAEFQNVLRITPGLPMALRALTQLNLAMANSSVAQIYAQELVQQDSGNSTDHLLLGEVLLRQGKNKDAEAQFLAAKQLTPNDPGVHLDLAMLYEAEKNVNGADKEFQTALQIAPQDASALEQYAGFLVLNGQQTKAVSMLQQFLVRNPKDVSAHLILSGVQSNAKNYSAARTEAESAIQIDEKSAPAYLQLGQVLTSQGDDNGALQAYQKALSIYPQNAVLITQVGNVYLKQGDLDKAAVEFQKAIGADPNFSAAENNLAWVYAEQGQNLDVALGLAQKAKSQDPSQLTFTDTLAWVMYKKGDYSGAIPYLQDCVKKSPETGQFRYHLGMALVASGQKQQGKELLQAALKMNLDNADLQQARQVLSRDN